MNCKTEKGRDGIKLQGIEREREMGNTKDWHCNLKSTRKD
jgi:hypothetical protein